MAILLGYVLNFVVTFVFFAFSISIHECAHAYSAYRLGDSTAKDQGRITLNPLKHLDPLGTLMIFLIKFGWAKPTPVNAMYFKDRKKGIMITSLAGPVSNLLFAILLAFPLLYFQANLYRPLNGYIYAVLNIGFNMNLILAVFNMLPIPPLDGSKILSGILPSSTYYRMMEYETYITIIFIILMFSGILSKTILLPIVSVIKSAIIYIVFPIVKLII
jgi:Zn-dependent protease